MKMCHLLVLVVISLFQSGNALRMFRASTLARRAAANRVATAARTSQPNRALTMSTDKVTAAEGEDLRRAAQSFALYLGTLGLSLGVYKTLPEDSALKKQLDGVLGDKDELRDMLAWRPLH